MDTALILGILGSAGAVANALFTLRVERHKSELVRSANAEQSRLGVVAQMNLKLYEKMLESYVSTRTCFEESARLIGEYGLLLDGEVEQATAQVSYDAALRATNSARTGCILVPASCKPALRKLLVANSNAVFELRRDQNLLQPQRSDSVKVILQKRTEETKGSQVIFDAWQDAIEEKPNALLTELQAPHVPSPRRLWWFQRPGQPSIMPPQPPPKALAAGTELPPREM